MRILIIALPLLCVFSIQIMTSYKNHRPEQLDAKNITEEAIMMAEHFTADIKNIDKRFQPHQELPAYLKKEELKLSPNIQADLAATRAYEKMMAGYLIFFISDAKTHFEPFRFINTFQALLCQQEKENMATPLATTTHKAKKMRPEL